LVICILVGVAFMVPLEPRVLGYVHIRKGPNEVGFVGLFQSFSDAIKLFTREQYLSLVSNYISYCFSPIFGLFLSCRTEYYIALSSIKCKLRRYSSVSKEL
jgi:NADH:ubiquinone oxidoreductase subunit H